MNRSRLWVLPIAVERAKPSRASHSHSQFLQSAEERHFTPLRLRTRIGQAHIREAHEEGEKGNLRFHPRQRRADAQMQAAAEGHVRRVLAGNVETVRIGKG